MTRRRVYLYCVLLALPLLALRFIDILSGAVEIPSGYFARGASWFHILQLALAVAAAALATRALKGIEPAAFGAGSRAARATLALASAAAVAVSVLQLARVFSTHSLAQFFMTRAQLTAIGVKIDGFKLAALCALVGFAAAAWFAVSAYRGSLARALALSAAPSAWFALRAVVCFAKGPVNSGDTATVAEIAACMSLAAAYGAIGRVASLGEDAGTLRRAGSFAALSALFALGFALPNAYFYVAAGSETDALFALAAGLAALAAVALVCRSVVSGGGAKELMFGAQQAPLEAQSEAAAQAPLAAAARPRAKRRERARSRRAHGRLRRNKNKARGKI